MTTRRPVAGYRPEVRSDLRVQLERHGVTALAIAFAAGALVHDLVSPSVQLDSTRYDRGPEAVIAAVLVGVVVLVALRGRLGVVAPLSAIALLGLATLTARAWVLDSGFVFLLVMLVCGLGGYLTTSRLSQAGVLVIWRRLAQFGRPHRRTVRPGCGPAIGRSANPRLREGSSSGRRAS